MTQDKRSSVVLLSGGLDSATTLALALEQGFTCHALSLEYGQRHGAELAAARRIAQAMRVEEHKVMTIGLDAMGGSALTDPSIAVPEGPTGGIPVTYVPARNTIFLSFALAFAEIGLHRGTIQLPVSLSAWTLYGRSLGSVQYPELNPRRRVIVEPRGRRTIRRTTTRHAGPWAERWNS